LGDNLRRRSRLGLARHAQPDAMLYTLWVNKMSVARDDRASLPLSAAEAEAGSYKRHLGSAEETVTDYMPDRCELSGKVSCGDKRQTPSNRIANASAATSAAKSIVTRTVCLL